MCIGMWSSPSRVTVAEAALRAAYRRTVYAVPEGSVRIGRCSPVVDRLLLGTGRRDAVLITAWNPYSRRMPPGWNLRRQQALAAMLRRFPTWPAQGRARGWAEDHLLVLMPHAQGQVLARRFQQNAIIALRRGQPARLVYC